MFEMLGALGASAGALGASAFDYAATQSTNRQNMMMNTGAWKGQQLLAEAAATGLSPLVLAGNAPQNIPMQAASIDSGVMGQSMGRAAAAVTPKDDRLAALQIQNAELQNRLLGQDVIEKQMANSRRAAIFQPSVPLNGPAIPLPLEDPRYEPEIKPLMQRFRGSSGLVVGPSSAVQQSLWSPIPGLPANPAVLGEITHQNAPEWDDPIRPDYSRYITDMTNALGY